jgi:chromosome partitioning protein
MQVISFASSKGGPGKTTLAASLGVAAMEAGERPYLIDVDPQGSLRVWGERRHAENLPVDRVALPP